MSFQSNLSKFEKEKLKLIQEKCQTLLNDMLRDEDNKYCVDCDAKGPRWASWNLGIFLCIRCAGIHRNLGVHISRVKSVNLDSWTPEQVVTIQQMGNSRARAVYEANMPDTLRRPQTDSALESFIRAKYEHKKYIAKEWTQPPPVKVNWDTEIEESLRKTKEAKRIGGSTDIIGPLPTPVSKPPKISSMPKQKNPVIDVGKVVASKGKESTASNGQQPPVTTTSAADDLLGIITDTQTAGTTNVFSQTPTTTTGATPNSNTDDDFSSIFTATDSTVDLGKMTKESILSLYGSAPAPAPAVNINPFIQSAGGASFGNINLMQPAAGTSGSNLGFQMPLGFPPNSNVIAQPQQHSISQQQMNSMPGMNQNTMNPIPGLNQNQFLSNFGAPLQHDISQVQSQLLGLSMGNLSAPPQIQPGIQNQSVGLPFMAPQFSQIPTNAPPINNFMSNQIYPPSKADNLPGLGNSVSQLMHPNLAGSNFWK